tara:strand:+ start:115 stop:861 length:747 start_codon:yes stop_codon:yes gene_type:complete
MKKILFKIFGLAFNGDSAMYDRYIWLKKNLVLLNENSKLLDIGCGNGWALFMGQKLGFKNSIGLSWDNKDLQRIKSRTNNFKNIELRVGDARKLDQLKIDEKFDAVINAENIEHIIDAEKLIKDISNLLNDGGLLYLTTPNILYKNIYKDSIIKIPLVEDGGHVIRGYSKERLNKILKKYNLNIVSVEYIGGKFSRGLLNFQRLIHAKIFSKIFTIPLSILFNFLDNIFFKNDKNNLSIAIVAEKINL